MLTEAEITSVVDWMVSSSGLDIVPFDSANLYTENYIQYIYLAEPDKTEALNYLATGANKPVRRAHVHVSLAGLSGNPCIRQYTVGPIPIDGTTALSAPLQFGGIADVPFDARPTNAKEYEHLDVLIGATMAELEMEMRESFGTNFYLDECPDDFCLTYSDTSPRGPARDLTLWFAFDVEAFFANPVGMYLVYSMGGLDTTKHGLKLIVYNGQSFPTVAAFKAAYQAGTVKKIVDLMDVLKENTNGVDWASMIKSPSATGVRTGRGQVTRKNSNLPAADVYEPAGKRFAVQDSYVEYLGWTFSLSHNPISGIKLFNVRYRGDSVAYEIGLSEAIAVYSGVNDLVQAATIYGDTAWGLGASTKELVKGIDCPATGILSDVSFLFDAGEASVLVNTICIFEMAGQTPLRRHSDGDSYGGLPTTSLVVRIVLPVYNYDYVVDHVFHVTGAIELRASTSGYLQSTFYSPELDKETTMFGQRIGPFTAGTTHDHVMNFKIDLDVLGTKNSLLKTETTAVKATPQDIDGVAYKVSNFDVALDYKTKLSTTTPVLNEQGFTMGTGATMFNVVAKDATNAWGAKRGYKLKLHGIVENGVAHTASLRAYSFSKHTFAATVRHEDEPTVSSIYDQSDTTGTIFKPKNNNVARPLVDMDRMLKNEEALTDADLVLWVNVGVYHHTHSEDIPVTLTNGNTVNIFLLPNNLYDYDDSMDLGNAVYAPSGGAMDSFDLQGATCALEYTPLGEGWVGGQTL